MSRCRASKGRPIAQLTAKEFEERVVGELTTLGLLDPRSVLESRGHFVPNAYPVYSSGHAREVGMIRDSLRATVWNLDVLGRAGRFVYSHLHDQLRFGRDYVQSLAATATENLRAHSA